MKKFKKIFLIFICFLLIFSIVQIPTSAIAVEIIGGSYVAYAILAAALAAAGYTIATSQIDSTTFQSILDSSGAEDIKALITATTVFTSVNGRVFFNWSAQQWGTFLNWVNNYVASGVLTLSEDIIYTGQTAFNANLISSYYEPFILTQGRSFGYQLGNCTLMTNVSGNQVNLKLNFTDCYFVMANAYWYTNGLPPVVFGSPWIIRVNNSGVPIGYSIIIGEGLKSNGELAQTIGECSAVQQSKNFEILANSDIAFYLNGYLSYLSYESNIVKLYYRGAGSRWLTYNIAPTANYTTSYSSLFQYMTDVINTGNLVGDWSGIGDDVINPSYPETEVGIDAYPDWRVGTGIDALPDELDVGTSIDIPLNRYIETDLGPDVIDPYVDFTPWDTITVPPDDVIPDTRINPPADVTANPDTPWADDQTYPIDYPRDTTADIPADPTWEEPDENTDPNENSNRMKLGPLILSKFPFCLPWDLQHGLKSLVAPGEAPVFDIPLKSVTAGIDENIHIDLSRFQSVTTVSRWFFSALWVVILILLTRKIVWK